MAAIQNINCRKLQKPLPEIKQNLGMTMFYRLTQDVTRAALASLDFQAGDSVEVDSCVDPTMEDVLMMLARDGTLVLVGLDDADEYRHLKYVGVVVTHLRPWTERRRAQSQRACNSHRQGSLATAATTLLNLASFRFNSLLQLACT